MAEPTTTQALTGAMLRAMREGLGLTLDELAEMTGLSKTSLSRYENGRRRLGNGAAHALERAIANHMHARTRSI
jgi:transcriptional regulator with XRE-family HTH domain